MQAKRPICVPYQHARGPSTQGREFRAALPAPELIESDAQCREHPKREQVELHQARVRAVFLIPLQHGTSLHGCPTHRTDTRDRLVGEHHATRMDAHVSRKARQCPCCFGNQRRNLTLTPRPGLRAARRITQSPRRIAHG